MSEYVMTFTLEKNKTKSNKLISPRTDDENLLKKYKAIWTNIEDLKNIKY